MTEQIQVSAGLDLHKSFIMATILTVAGEKLQERFDRTQPGLFALKECILDSELFRLSAELTDIFGKSGNLIMKGILNNMPVNDILALLPGSVKKKEGA